MDRKMPEPRGHESPNTDATEPLRWLLRWVVLSESRRWANPLRYRMTYYAAESKMRESSRGLILFLPRFLFQQAYPVVKVKFSVLHHDSPKFPKTQ